MLNDVKNFQDAINNAHVVVEHKRQRELLEREKKRDFERKSLFDNITGILGQVLADDIRGGGTWFTFENEEREWLLIGDYAFCQNNAYCSSDYSFIMRSSHYNTEGSFSSRITITDIEAFNKAIVGIDNEYQNWLKIERARAVERPKEYELSHQDRMLISFLEATIRALKKGEGVSADMGVMLAFGRFIGAFEDWEYSNYYDGDNDDE